MKFIVLEGQIIYIDIGTRLLTHLQISQLIYCCGRLAQYQPTYNFQQRVRLWVYDPLCSLPIHFFIFFQQGQFICPLNCFYLLLLVIQGQLFQLMQRLESTTPHFIRCIKPNNLQSPGLYEQTLVLQQLRCCGVLEVVRISRSGFPTRMSHQKFARR